MNETPTPLPCVDQLMWTVLDMSDAADDAIVCRVWADTVSR
jgi:hypothetical protein